MSARLGNADSKITIEGEVDSSVVILNEFRERGANGQDLTDSLNTATVNTDHNRKICLIAKLQSLFFPMKLFGLYMEDVRNPCQEEFSSRRRMAVFGKRLYQCLVLLVLWLNVAKTLASFWIFNNHSSDNSEIFAGMIWFLQTALQASICFFTMHITSKKSSLKNLMLYWNSQPNFDELVTEPYMIKCIKRTMILTYFLVALNSVFIALILFLPSESLQFLARGFISPLPINSTAVKAVCFVVFLYCTAAWLMPFAVFTAVCLTLIHQCSRLRKTMRLTASADGLARVKILRRQHSSLCGSVRKADDLFKFLTLVIYITNIPLVCFLLYHLIFVSYNDVTTLVILSWWFVHAVVIMAGVSFLGAGLNNKVCNY